MKNNKTQGDELWTTIKKICLRRRHFSAHRFSPTQASTNSQKARKLTLDLNQLLVRSSISSFIFRIEGHTYADQGIYDGDIAVIDRALSPRANDPSYRPRIELFRLCRLSQCPPDTDAWGIVTSIIHQFR